MEELENDKAKYITSKKRLDTKGKSLKYARDLDSNWSVRNNEPIFGMKEHTSIDATSSFVLSTCMSKASEYDYNYFQYIVTTGINGRDTSYGLCRQRVLRKE